MESLFDILETVGAALVVTAIVLGVIMYSVGGSDEIMYFIMSFGW